MCVFYVVRRCREDAFEPFSLPPKKRLFDDVRSSIGNRIAVRTMLVTLTSDMMAKDQAVIIVVVVTGKGQGDALTVGT